MTLPTSAPALRNREPIAARLAEVFATRQADAQPVVDVLEIASGTGEHIEHFAAAFPGMSFLPSDLSAEAVEQINRRLIEGGSFNNVREAQVIDVCAAWPVVSVDMVMVSNMFHISPWATVSGFFAGAQGILRAGGMVHVYGPFRRGGEHTAPSNAKFDESLRSRDSSWGIRDLEEVTEVARTNGFDLPDIRQMPANNLSLVFRQQ